MAFHCARCSYETDLNFAFDEHSRRKHGPTKAAEPFGCANSLPKCYLKQYLLIADYKISLLTEQPISRGHGGKESEGIMKSRTCSNCSWTCNSALVYLKHLQTCEKEIRLEPQRAIFLVVLDIQDQCSEVTERRGEPPKETAVCGDTAVAKKSYSSLIGKLKQQIQQQCRELSVSPKRQDLVHTDGDWFSCEHCSFSTNYEKPLMAHIATKHFGVPAHSDLHRYIKGKADGTKMWLRCDQCLFKADTPGNLGIHKNCFHGPCENVNWLKCLQCSYKSPTVSGLEQHFETQHAQKTAARIFWFRCRQCPFKARSLTELTFHTRNQHSKKIIWHNCEQCSYKSMYLINLRKHVSNRHARDFVQLFHCSYCSYKARSSRGLDAHKKFRHMTRKSGKWLSCNVCSYRTVYHSYLIKHIDTVHEGDDTISWFHCQQCSYKSRDRRDVEVHRVTLHKSNKNLDLVHCDQCS